MTELSTIEATNTKESGCISSTNSLTCSRGSRRITAHGIIPALCKGLIACLTATTLIPLSWYFLTSKGSNDGPALQMIIVSSVFLHGAYQLRIILIFWE